jgi:hypothetical protein
VIEFLKKKIKNSKEKRRREGRRKKTYNTFAYFYAFISIELRYCTYGVTVQKLNVKGQYFVSKTGSSLSFIKNARLPFMRTLYSVGSLRLL